MAFSSSGKKGPMGDINVTPLVDVMLVLLIIFIVTAPIMTYPIEVNLPQNVLNPPKPEKEPPPPIELRVDASNQIFWNNSPVGTFKDLATLMQIEVEKDPTNQPKLDIVPNSDASYEVIAKVVAAAQTAGMTRLQVATAAE